MKETQKREGNFCRLFGKRTDGGERETCFKATFLLCFLAPPSLALSPS